LKTRSLRAVQMGHRVTPLSSNHNLLTFLNL
jgi:hypothetical protein